MGCVLDFEIPGPPPPTASTTTVAAANTRYACGAGPKYNAAPRISEPEEGLALVPLNYQR